MIRNTILTIICDDVEILQRLNKWLITFKMVDTEQKRNLLIIKQSIIQLILNNRDIFKIKLESTDLYPILMNVISNLINNKDNIVLHSSVISKGRDGILILGTFGAGKTNLSLMAERCGYKINSADFSWLTIQHQKLYLKKGSCYLKYKSKERMLLEKDCNSRVNIKKVIYLIGVCDGGKIKVDKVENYKHIIKRIFPFANWHSNIPLIGGDIELPINNIYIKEFLMNFSELDIEFLLVRGDSSELISMFYDNIVI